MTATNSEGVVSRIKDENVLEELPTTNNDHELIRECFVDNMVDPFPSIDVQI